MAFQNRNVCKTFVLTCNGALQNLFTVFGNQGCTEVIIRPRTTSVVIYDDPSRPTVGFELLPNEEMTFRGITDIANLSALGTNNNKVYFRTQYFGSLTPGV